MASPFEIFRKNQRLWMAAAVLVAIISFVIAPMLQYFTGGESGRSGPNPVVASWSGGAMRVDQVQQDQADLRLVNQFLRELASKVDEKGGSPKVPSYFPQQNMYGITPYQSLLEPEVIIQRRLLQTEAQRMGIQFGDDAVTQFLQKFVDGKLDGKTIQKLMLSSTERRLTMTMFQRVMKEELVYQELMRLMRAGLNFEDVRNSQIVAMPSLTTPSKNWREFLRLNRTAKIKAYPVYVKDFFAEVKTKPSDKELKDLYAAGSSLIRMSTTLDATPAFMTPAMANLEYLSIDTEKFVQEEMVKIPETTLKAEYERRVAEKQFRVPIEAPKNDPTGLPSTTEPPTTPPATPTDATPKSEPSAGLEKPADPAPPTPTTESKSPTEPKADGNDLPKVTPADPPADTPKAPALDIPQSSSLSSTKGQVKLVSYQEEKPVAPAPSVDTPAPSTPVTPAVQSPDNPLREQKDAPKPSGDGTPAADAVKTSDSATKDADPPKSGDQPPMTETPVAPTLPALSIGDSIQPSNPADPVAETTPMRTQTFEEVKDRIARELATATATRIVEDKVREVYGLMNIYQSERYQYLRGVEEKLPDVVEPEQLDLKKIASEYGFDYGTTGMVDTETVMFHPIGQSAVSINPQSQPIPIGAFIQATQERGSVWTPLLSSSRSGQSSLQFLSWKTELKEPAVPSFDACKDKVTEVWTAQQALKLAEAKAADLASRVGSSQLEEILSSDEEKKKVVEPAPFTAMNPMYPMFMRFNMQAQMDEVGSVAPLQPVDLNFMEAVFSKKPGEATIAADRRKSVFYVVKILEMGDTKELLTKFQASPTESVGALVSRDNDRALGPMMEGIRKRLGFRAY